MVGEERSGMYKTAAAAHEFQNGCTAGHQAVKSHVSYHQRHHIYTYQYSFTQDQKN